MSLRGLYLEGLVFGILRYLTHFHEERDIAFTSDFCDNYSHPASPGSLVLTSPRPIFDVLKSLVSCPQVPSPHTRVPMSPSPCPRQVPVPLLYTAPVSWRHSLGLVVREHSALKWRWRVKTATFIFPTTFHGLTLCSRTLKDTETRPQW